MAKTYKDGRIDALNDAIKCLDAMDTLIKNVPTVEEAVSVALAKVLIHSKLVALKEEKCAV